MTNQLQIINQLFEIQTKINTLGEANNFERNFNRLFSIFEEDGFTMQDPTNETYNEARTDCEASIVGQATSNMKITKTIKPIIYKRVEGNLQLVQKAVVVVEKK
jgi:hypothetical protein